MLILEYSRHGCSRIMRSTEVVKRGKWRRKKNNNSFSRQSIRGFTRKYRFYFYYSCLRFYFLHTQWNVIEYARLTFYINTKLFYSSTAIKQDASHYCHLFSLSIIELLSLSMNDTDASVFLWVNARKYWKTSGSCWSACFCLYYLFAPRMKRKTKQWRFYLGVILFL